MTAPGADLHPFSGPRSLCLAAQSYPGQQYQASRQAIEQKSDSRRCL
jgi:hypothetical protein